MLDMQEVNQEIARLEKEETTYPNCSKLAVLYSISDHNQSQERRIDSIEEYSFGSSEFLTLASRAPIEDVLSILDEHLEAVALIYPKEYSAVIRKIKERASI